jgi:hypothetical protein
MLVWLVPDVVTAFNVEVLGMFRLLVERASAGLMKEICSLSALPQRMYGLLLLTFCP